MSRYSRCYVNTFPGGWDMQDAIASGEPSMRNATPLDHGSAGGPTENITPAPAKQVLIVEDERVVAKDLARSLLRLGYHVVARAATGEEANHLAQLWNPDLILMDIRLRGELDGIATVERIHEHSDVPVIFLTAFSDRQTIERAMRTRPFGYVVKPFQDVELRCAIEVALNRHQMERQVRDSEAAYRRLSTIDELTGLPNRRGFSELAEQQLKVACRYRQPLVLCFADLDGLKVINDRLGHSAGDSAIRAAAVVLRDTFRGSDIVARLAGDEFAVLAIASAQSGVDSALQRLTTNLSRFNATPRPFRLDLSLGMARHEVGVDEGLDDLLARADADMYAQKQHKRSLSMPAAQLT